MKNILKLIYLYIFIFLISCSDARIITKLDYNEKIDKDYQINILKKEVESKKYEVNQEYYDELSKIYIYDKDSKKISYYVENLVEKILKNTNFSKESLSKLYNLNIYNIQLYNYIAILELKNESYFNAHNIAWTSKTFEPTYLSDEIFLYFALNSNEKREVEEIVYDMSIKFKDYPFNKFNQLLYKNNFDIKNIDETFFNEVRNDVRKINYNFYPELEIYKIDYLMMIDLIEANYYFETKQVNKLKELKEIINKTNILEKIDLKRINDFIENKLKNLEGE